MKHERNCVSLFCCFVSTFIGSSNPLWRWNKAVKTH
jgi:hypothetical protein